MLSLVKTETFTLVSHDTKIDSIERNINTQNSLQLSSTILLKTNMLVELVGGNYSIEDGLVNGAEGVFKYYTQIPTDIVWIEFSDEKSGVLA